MVTQKLCHCDSMLALTFICSNLVFCTIKLLAIYVLIVACTMYIVPELEDIYLTRLDPIAVMFNLHKNTLNPFKYRGYHFEFPFEIYFPLKIGFIETSLSILYVNVHFTM